MADTLRVAPPGLLAVRAGSLGLVAAWAWRAVRRARLTLHTGRRTGQVIPVQALLPGWAVADGDGDGQ